MEVDDAAHASDFINRLDNLHHRNKHMKTVIGEISGKVQLAAKNLRKVEKVECIAYLLAMSYLWHPV